MMMSELRSLMDKSRSEKTKKRLLIGKSRFIKFNL